MKTIKGWIVRTANLKNGYYSDISFETREQAREHKKMLKGIIKDTHSVDVYRTLTTSNSKDIFTTAFFKSH